MRNPPPPIYLFIYLLGANQKEHTLTDGVKRTSPFLCDVIYEWSLRFHTDLLPEVNPDVWSVVVCSQHLQVGLIVGVFVPALQTTNFDNFQKTVGTWLSAL